MNQVLVTECTVVDGRLVEGAEPLVDAAILIRDGRIAAVGPRQQVADQAAGNGSVHRIGLDGAYVTPGLVNMHTHLSLSLPGDEGDRVRSLDAPELALYMADGARRTVLSGVTAVRCVAEKDHADFALRRAIAAGLVPGPRVFTAGRALVCTGGHGHEVSETLECDGPDEFRRGVRAQVKAGADLIKVMLSGGIAGERESIDTRQLHPDEIAAVITTAHHWGRKVSPTPVRPTSSPRLSNWAWTVSSMVTSSPLTSRPEWRSKARRWCPLCSSRDANPFFDEQGVPDWMQARSLDAGPRHLASFRTAVDAGVDVLLGRWTARVSRPGDGRAGLPRPQPRHVAGRCRP